MRQLELTERILRLRGVPTLRALAANDLAPLAASLRHVGFRRGERLLAENEPPRSFFLVTNGTVNLMRHEKAIGTVRAPGGVGFMSFLARFAGGTSAIADSYVEALEIDAEAMEEIFEDHFSVLLGTIRFVAERWIAESKDRPLPPATGEAISFDHLVTERELGIMERIYLVRRMIAANEVNVNSVATLARRMVEIRAPSETVLWKPGDPSEHSYFVVKGKLRLDLGKSVQTLRAGDVIGGAESIAGLPRWNGVTTDGPVVLLRSARDGLVDLFEDDHAFGMRFLAMLATHLVTMWDLKAAAGIPSLG